MSVVGRLERCVTLSDIAADMIRQSLKAGSSVVVRGAGTSMEPTISSGDRLKIVASDVLSVGDIVLVQMRPDVFVAHRIIDITHTQAGTFITTKGDNLSQPDHPVPQDYVIGKVVAISHSSMCKRS